MRTANDHTYSLDDLKSWNAQGEWLAVLGYPIRHSLSPHMHNAALDTMSLEEAVYRNWQYVRFEIPVEQLEEALQLLHKHKFRGVNLTIPHKVEALKYIYALDGHAEALGAVNTLKWEQTGYCGYNTDGYGMETAISRNLDVSLHAMPVVLLGAGGASRAAAIQCLEKGCPELWIGNRSRARLDALLASVKQAYPDAPVKGFLFEEGVSFLPKTALLINATSSGLKPDDRAPVDFAYFSTESVLFDMIYNPETTVSMKAALGAGMRACNGLDMLIYQGARALEIWTGRSAIPAGSMRAAATASLSLKS